MVSALACAAAARRRCIGSVVYSLFIAYAVRAGFDPVEDISARPKSVLVRIRAPREREGGK